MSTIPKPKSLKFKTLEYLHCAMVRTHPDLATFQEFKYWIQFYACNMDIMKSKEHYSVEAWASFLDKILAVEPGITFYEAYWPVEAYFNSYMAHRRRKCKFGHGPKKTRKRFNNVENAGSSSSKQSLSIDDTQQSKSRGPSRSRSSLCKSFDEHLVTHFEDRLDNKASRSVLLARSQSPECTIASSSSTASVPVSLKHHTSKNSHVVSSQKSVHDHSKDKLVVTCCGNTMTVKSKFNKRLVDLIGNVDLLSNLAKLGIFLDQHLDDLLHLKHHDLMEFLSDVASNQMTPLAKLQLIKTLQVESSDTRKRKSQALHLPFIPCPPLDRRLSDPNQVDNGLFHDLLQKATKLEDDEFQELINAIETKSRDYISIYRPNADQLCQVVTAICDDCSLLRQYENLWPLKILLKRQSTFLCTHPRYSELEAEVVFSKVFKNQRHCELPTLVQLPCELHPFIDISHVPHTLKTRLHSLGIAGLIPALTYVGVHNDAHFADFCKLNDQERDDLFILGKLKLSQFQKFILRLALSSVN